MQRILIIVTPGSGKSTLARALAVKSQLPILHLDRLLWQPGWVQTEPSALDEKIAFAVGEPHWIMEGMFARTLQQRLMRADTVIWLDLPRSVCLARVLWRTLRHYRRTRPDMTPGCPERFDLEFFRYIWSFRAAERPKILAAIETHGAHCQMVRLTSPRETSRYLASFT